MTTGESTPRGNVYDKYGTGNPVEARLMGGFFRALDRAVGVVDPSRVLEVGAGEGEVSSRVGHLFPDAAVVGLDLPDETMARHWSDRRLRGVFGDMHDLPFPDRSFDLVLAIEVLEHVTFPDIALAEIERVARHTVVLSVPREPIWRAANIARGKYLPRWGNTPGHVNHWSARGFREVVGRRFDVEWAATPFPWTVLRATRR